jgi:hypothetical protein
MTSSVACTATHELTSLSSLPRSGISLTSLFFHDSIIESTGISISLPPWRHQVGLCCSQNCGEQLGECFFSILDFPYLCPYKSPGLPTRRCLEQLDPRYKNLHKHFSYGFNQHIPAYPIVNLSIVPLPSDKPEAVTSLRVPPALLHHTYSQDSCLVLLHLRAPASAQRSIALPPVLHLHQLSALT